MEKYNNHFKNSIDRTIETTQPNKGENIYWKKKIERQDCSTHQGLLYTPGTALTPGTAESIQKTLNLCDKTEEKRVGLEKDSKK